MIGSTFTVPFADGHTETVTISQYAFSRISRWARQNAMPGFSMDTLETSEDKILWLHLALWAECSRGAGVPKPGDFDEWLVTVVVDDIDIVEGDPVDPTQPATSAG